MEFLLGFLTITAIAILGVISPGPDTAIIAKNSLLKSRADGIATTLGVVLGNVLYVSLALLGLGAIIASSVLMFSIIKYCGAAYLVYLGIKLLFSPASPIAPRVDTQLKGTSTIAMSLREGFLTNLGNPKFMVFLLALFTQVIDPNTLLAVQMLYVYQIPLIAFIWFTTLSLLLTTDAIRSRIAPIMHHAERVAGAALILLGVRVALQSNA